MLICTPRREAKSPLASRPSPFATLAHSGKRGHEEREIPKYSQRDRKKKKKSHQPPPKRLCDASVQSFPAQRHHAPRFGSAKQLGAFLLLARCSYPAARKALSCWLRGTQKQPQAKAFGLPASLSAQWAKQVVVALLAKSLLFLLCVRIRRRDLVGSSGQIPAFVAVLLYVSFNFG
ncbi:hypothetical protein CSPX01_01815 [Colletotrichum filicis]|nr:hypothetical protein CSPX01_01815 [Colletotrichum filicis]